MDEPPAGIPDPSGAEPAQPDPAQPVTDLAGLTVSRRTLDAWPAEGGVPGPLGSPRPPSDLTATMPIIVIPPDDAPDAPGRLGRAANVPGGRHRGGMRVPRGVPIAAGFIAAVGAGIGLVFAATGGGSQPSGTPPLGARLPDAGVGLSTAPASTATDGGTTDSATPNPGAPGGTTPSHPTRTSVSQASTPKSSASQSPAPQTSITQFSVPQSSGQPSAPSSTSLPSTPPMSTPGPTLVTSTTTTPSPPPSTPSATATCHVTWKVTNSWNNGFQLGFTVTNSGTVPISGWHVSYSWAGGQTAVQIWDASATQSGATVNVTNLSYNGSLSPNGTATFGLNGQGSVPSTLTGLQCSAR